MKTDATGVNATPRTATTEVTAKKTNRTQKGAALRSHSGANIGRVSDTVTLSKSPSEQVPASGDYSSEIRQTQRQRTQLKNNSHPMSELKNRADERLKQFSSASDAVESVSELKLNDDRKDMVEIARLRVKSGFYDRPDVIDEIARRIIEGV